MGEVFHVGELGQMLARVEVADESVEVESEDLPGEMQSCVLKS